MTAANDIFANFATDEKAELEGRVVPYTADSSFVVARAGNKNYNRLLSNLWKRNKVALDAKGDAAEALSDRLLVEIIAKTILLGWTNIKFQGADLPYSVENAQKLLSIKDFRKYIVELSNDFEAFKQEEEAEEEKNYHLSIATNNVEFVHRFCKIN